MSTEKTGKAHLTVGSAESVLQRKHNETWIQAMRSLTATVDPFLPTPPVIMMATFD
jgi:hypothetical protein